MKAHNTNRPPRTDQNTKENIWDGRGKLDNEGTDLPQGCGQQLDLDHLTMIHRESDDLGVSSTIGRVTLFTNFCIFVTAMINNIGHYLTY